MSERRQHLDLFAMALLALLCFLWGLQQVSIKLAASGVPPVMQAAIRSIGATVLLSLWMALRNEKLFERDGSLIPGVSAGLLFGCEFLFIYWGLSYTTASRSIVFLYTAPFAIALGAHFFLPQEKLTLFQNAGLLLAFIGVAAAFADGLSSSFSGAFLGDALALTAAIMWGATTVLIKASRLAHVSPAKTLFYQLAVSSAMLLPASLLMGEGGIVALSPLVLGCLVFQTVVVAFASYLAWFWLVAHYPAAKLGAFSFLTPLFGLASGGVILSEPITPSLLAALVCVASGIWLVNRQQARS